MWRRSILFLLTANILHISRELGINRMDFCCSNTCCCSSCTAEQCQLPDQPGKQCRCYNTTSVTCSRFRNSIYKAGSIIRNTNRQITDKIQIFPIFPEQSVMSQIVPVGITEFDTDPLCCAVGNCPAWMKCKHSSIIKRNQSASQSMPMPLFIVACILFALIIITTIGLCIAASLYISDSHKRRSCDFISDVDIYEEYIELCFLINYHPVSSISSPDCATKCYAGKNSKYISRSCEGGGSNSKEFVCQKFICEGGKSPFVLRTCANKRLGCLAGPSICRFSGGTGSCARCQTNNCNS